MMAVEHYDLDRRVFHRLQAGIQHLQEWQGAASGIADYVATWGLERFWSMSRSMALLGGSDPGGGAGQQ